MNRLMLYSFLLLFTASCEKWNDDPEPYVGRIVFSGKVLDSETGKPIEGATVQVYEQELSFRSSLGAEKVAEVKSGPNGVFSAAFQADEYSFDYFYVASATNYFERDQGDEVYTKNHEGNVDLDIGIMPHAYLNFRIILNKGADEFNLGSIGSSVYSYYPGADTNYIAVVKPRLPFSGFYHLYYQSNDSFVTARFETIGPPGHDTDTYYFEF